MTTNKIIKILNMIRDDSKKQIESKELSGMVIVVTGATGAIGQEIVNELFQKDAYLVLFGRDENKLSKIFKDYDMEKVSLISGAVSKEADIKNLFNKALEKYGKVDVLINCMGAFADGDIEKLNIEDVENVFDVNVRSVFLTCREAVSIMKKRKSGIIINIGSRISHNSNITPGKTLYASSKYALEGFSNALSKSVSKYNIRVVCLLPATVSTFVTKDFFKYMVPSKIAKIITFVISMDGIDFDPISFKSSRQNI